MTLTKISLQCILKSTVGQRSRIISIQNPLMMNIFREEITKLMEFLELKIDIKCNCKIVDYTDVTLDLNDDSYYKPIRKPFYAYVESNHPHSIIGHHPFITVNTKVNRNEPRYKILQKL